MDILTRHFVEVRNYISTNFFFLSCTLIYVNVASLFRWKLLTFKTEFADKNTDKKCLELTF